MAPELVEEFIRAFQNEINLQRRENDAQVERLQHALNEPEIQDEALQILRALIERVSAHS